MLPSIRYHNNWSLYSAPLFLLSVIIHVVLLVLLELMNSPLVFFGGGWGVFFTQSKVFCILFCIMLFPLCLWLFFFVWTHIAWCCQFVNSRFQDNRKNLHFTNIFYSCMLLMLAGKANWYIFKLDTPVIIVDKGDEIQTNIFREV